MKKEEIKQLVEVMKSCISIELHVKDFEPVKKFYTNIGFEVIFDSPGNYLVLRKGKAILNFWGDGKRYPKQPYFRNYPENSKKGFDVEIIIPIEDIEDYYLKIKDKVKIIEELKDRRWRAKDFRIEDLNGFYIRFTEPHDWVFGFEGYTSDED